MAIVGEDCEVVCWNSSEEMQISFVSGALKERLEARSGGAPPKGATPRDATAKDSRPTARKTHFK